MMKERHSLFLYEKIIIDIKKKISSGLYPVGEQLPTEYELCEIYDASRITIRKAIKQLEEDDILIVKHGRGTFVKKNNSRMHFLNFNGFADGLQNGTSSFFTKKIHAKNIVKGNEKLQSIFKKDESEEYLELIRTVSDESEIFCLDYAYFPLSLYPQIETVINEQDSTLQILKEDYHMKFYKAIKDIVLVYPNNEISSYMKIGGSIPLYKVTKEILDAAYQVIHYSEYYLVAEKAKLHFEIDVDE